jgi:hypothetical protein
MNSLRHTKIFAAVFYSLAFAFLLIELFLLYSPKITFITADLGRHIKNGELLVREGHLIKTNYYSYTDPDKRVVNHHWATGVVFYYLVKFFGFDGISFIFALFMLSTFLIFFFSARRFASFPYVYAAAVLSIPLITSRTEIRPEFFSFFFLGTYFLLLLRFKDYKINFTSMLITLSICQILWVNSHIFFIMGIFIVSAFLIDEMLNQKNRLRIKQFLILLAVLSMSCLVNPLGIEGALSPLTIFKEYGYRLAENQPVLFMKKRFPENLMYAHFIYCFIALCVCILLTLRKKNWREHALLILILAAFSVLSWKAIRCFPLFGFFFIPAFAFYFEKNMKQFLTKFFPSASVFVLMAAASLIGAGLIGKNNYYSPYQALQLPVFIEGIERKPFWIAHVLRNPRQLFGLAPNMQLSADFFNRFNLRGPVFNNYDIGGYLIFNLFPEEKVFVDNRPEAYDDDFFKKTYVPMQEDEEKWKEIDAKYYFNAIYFYRHDFTPWAQPFLIRRVQDPQWAPVFVDRYTIILLKRNIENEELIRRFELPKGIFSLQENQ